MNDQVERQCLQFISDEWEGLSHSVWPREATSRRPWGVWIAQYAPIPQNWNTISLNKNSNSLRKTWFLDDKKGLTLRHSNEFARFITVHFFRPWWHLLSGPKNDVFGNPHQIGIACFAQLQDSDQIFIQTTWGLRYGHGYQTKLDEQGFLQVVKLLWRS